MIHLVQIGNGSARRVAIVEEPHLRCLTEVQSVYELVRQCLDRGIAIERAGTCAREWRGAGLRRNLFPNLGVVFAGANRRSRNAVAPDRCRHWVDTFGERQRETGHASCVTQQRRTKA